MNLRDSKSLLLTLVRYFDSICGHLPRIGRLRPLRGHFSAAEALKQEELPGKMLMRAQKPGSCQSGSLTHFTGKPQNNHQPWPIFWVRSDDARLVGKMLLWRDSRDRLCSEGAFHTTKRQRLKEDQFFAQIYLSNRHQLPGAWTSIVSNWGNGGNYFHWFCDSLTRLMVREQLPEKTQILIPSNPTRFVKETLEMLGLSDLCLEAPASNVQPERFYFCSPTAMTGVWNPLGFDWLRKKFARFRQPIANGRPIFLTRRGATRIPPNIYAIEALFSANGFEIIDCGKQTVKEQIRLASAAPAIAGLHGAAMTNILWAHPNTPVLEIFQPEYLNACYEQIAFQGKLAYRFLITDSSSSKTEILHWIKQVI